MKCQRRNCAVIALIATFVASSFAEIIPVREMELDGEAFVTASTWDIGHKDALFDQNWSNIYRSAAVNPAIITVEFVDPQATGAARAKFSNTSTHDWTLEAADSLADLDSQSGTYVRIFGPIRVEGDGVIQWTEWNDTPVTRMFYRFTVYRVYGDDYVHIVELELQSPEPVDEIEIGGQTVRVNTLQVTPEEEELPIGETLQYAAEASLSYGPDRYDVASLATWSSSDPGVATIDAGGLATAVGGGTTTISADLGILHAEGTLTTRAPRTADLDVGFIHRTPEYNRFKVSFSGDQHIMEGYENEQKWPAPGEIVTYTAHVFNKGDADATDVVYLWYFDGELVDGGTISLVAGGTATTVAYSAPWPADTVQTVDVPAGAMDLHPKQLERAVGDHTIRFVLDPADEIPELCELNNEVEDYINALTFWMFMDETTYAYFHDHANFLESYSAEDWCQMQLVGFQRRLRVSGCPQRVRLDMVAVYPDGGLSAGGTHEPVGSETRQADGRWGFQIGEWPDFNVQRYVKTVQNPLMHEWGHQIGLIDVYQYDIATPNCLITNDGTLVADTDLMPRVSPWNVYYGNIRVQHAGGIANVDWTARAVMADPSRRYLGPGSAAGMNRNLGLRRGFFGDYLGAIQQGEIALHVRHYGGTPVANCQIRVFQRALDSTVPDNPKFVGVTDAAGAWVFPSVTEPGWEGGMAVNNPWSWQQGGTVYDAPDAVGRNAALVVELEYGNTVEYHFIEPDECNLAMAAAQVDDYTFELVTYSSRSGNTLPVISFNGAPTHVYLDEGELFEAVISATDADADPVTLSTTPLYNTTFNPATGRFTFRPDSLQVNISPSHTEEMYIDFKADDGKFAVTERMWFHVSDIPGFAYVDEGIQCPGDLDGDGDVDLSDLAQLLAHYGTSSGAIYEDGDIDQDGDVDLSDLAALLAVYGQPCG